MCTLRAIWIIKGDSSLVQDVKSSSASIVLSRRFPTVETRLKTICGSKYQPVPNDSEFLQLFKQEVILKESSEGNRTFVSLKNNSLWPFVYVKKFGAYFVTIPSVEDKSTLHPSERPPLIELPYVTGALMFVESLTEFAAAFAPEFNIIKMAELQSYLAKVVPFGKPTDTNFQNITTMVRQEFPTSLVGETTIKRPAWKPYLHKGKQKIDLIIHEEIQAVQYDSEKISDKTFSFGSILCKAELEGLPEVTITVINTKATRPETGDFTFDACVNIPESGSSASSKSLTPKICFTPPLDLFMICRYKILGSVENPIRGFYQMKEVNSREVKALIQLKLSDKVNNSFQYCEVDIPFANRGIITNIDVAPSTGSVAVTSNRKSLKWNIGNFLKDDEIAHLHQGQKFGARNLEVALPLTVQFDGKSDSTDDPFLVGPNAFIQIRFKILSDTLSGTSIDTNTLTIYPNTKAQINIEREIVADDYIIWNSLGEVRHAV